MSRRRYTYSTTSTSDARELSNALRAAAIYHVYMRRFDGYDFVISATPDEAQRIADYLGILNLTEVRG